MLKGRKANRPLAPAASSSLCAYLKNANRISGDTGSDEAVFRVKSWLNVCSRDHIECQSKSQSPLPTRVILIEDSRHVRLVSSHGATAPYACLSYRWGTQCSIQTTRSSLDRFQKGIPWDNLPATFRDAISFVHRLGIRYLWIDSLCILQDSGDDWQHEGSKMARIYQGAIITIAAVLNSDPTEPLFRRSYSQHLSRYMPIGSGDEEAVSIHYREPLRHDTHPPVRPLEDRGWAFQERLLSHRVILFERQEIWWECHHSIACECSGIADDRRYTSGRKSHAYNKIRASSSVQDLQRSWEQLVAEYKGKSLTKPSDIFPALQGLAKVMPSIMGSYLAGHWSAALIHSLTWFNVFQVKRPPVQYEWRAPTWSWASSHQKIMWSQDSPRLCHNLCTLLNAEVVPIGDDVTGQLKSGQLVIRGKLLAGKLRQRKNKHDIPMWEVGFETDTHGPFWSIDDCWRVSWDRSMAVTQRMASKSTVVKALQLCENDGDSCHQYWLAIATSATESTYERLGLMEIDISDVEGQNVAKIFESMAEESVVSIV
ncbi:hypothetical protein SVAN01_08834 [Stagonosporopsis vannaccii]|nr:hypothetical protein SVAN01_08834 [Stagonosporopsis vannaccii]